MRLHCFGAFLAILLTAACASLHTVTAVPKWERYQQGALAGFLEAPNETPVQAVPAVVVRRVQGRIVTNGDEFDPLQVNNYQELRPAATIHQSPNPYAGSGREQLTDASVFVVELRGSGSGAQVRTLAARGGLFDFGQLPNGTYTLKATVLGWRAAVGTVTVSDSADPAARITIKLKPAV
jgi:hypothetical protein